MPVAHAADTDRPIHVIAMGGNSLIDRSLPPTVANQFAVTARAIVPIADLLERGERIVITHGNGPQVGFMALRSELSKEHIHEVPLDSIVADTQGAIGYMIQRALREELRRRELDHQVASIITEVECDPEDQAFGHPTKPIGRFYTEAESKVLANVRGWKMVEDAHRGYRRVVASPAPVHIVQLPIVQSLLQAGTSVVCCGGGGIPVVRHDDGHIEGLEAVIDKDRVSALLGVRLGARKLFITTATDAIYVDYGTPQARRLSQITVAELRELQAQGQFPAGSMGPKVEAAIRFLIHGGEEVVICSTDALVEAFAGDAGTRIRME